MPAITLLIVTV